MGNCSIKIAHISDLHIGQSSDAVQGIDVRKNFKRALYSDSVKNSDFIFLSGDLADHGESGAYDFVAIEMKKMDKPWAWIPGNHDDLIKASSFLPMFGYVQGTTFDYILDIKGYRFLCIDNSSGEIQPRQLEWIKSHADVPFSIFMHYPPCYCNHAFMDSKYPMNDITIVQGVLSKLENLKFIFSGHYHSAHHIIIEGNKEVFVAPSTQMQIAKDSRIFKLESSLPAWQILNFNGNELDVEIKKE